LAAGHLCSGPRHHLVRCSAQRPKHTTTQKLFHTWQLACAVAAQPVPFSPIPFPHLAPPPGKQSKRRLWHAANAKNCQRVLSGWHAGTRMGLRALFGPHQKRLNVRRRHGKVRWEDEPICLTSCEPPSFIFFLCRRRCFRFVVHNCCTINGAPLIHGKLPRGKMRVVWPPLTHVLPFCHLPKINQLEVGREKWRNCLV